MATNVSDDLVWEIVNPYNAYLVKRKGAGGVLLSRDPLNLTNKHARKYDGFVNTKAVGIQPTPKGGQTVTTKKPDAANKPASCFQETELSEKAGPRKAAALAAQKTAKDEYRPDLRAEAVARASAIKKASNPKRDAPATKLRGAKARKEAEGLSAE